MWTLPSFSKKWYWQVSWLSFVAYCPFPLRVVITNAPTLQWWVRTGFSPVSLFSFKAPSLYSIVNLWYQKIWMLSILKEMSLITILFLYKLYSGYSNINFVYYEYPMMKSLFIIIAEQFLQNVCRLYCQKILLLLSVPLMQTVRNSIKEVFGIS